MPTGQAWRVSKVSVRTYKRIASILIQKRDTSELSARRTKNIMNSQQPDRRRKSRDKDGFYQFVLTVNSVCWLVLIGALVVFHFARPEMVTGLQTYWGIEGRATWSEEHVDALIMLLQLCLGMTLLTMLLRSRRNRRREDNYGVNLFILAGISMLSLFTLNVSVA